MSCSGAQESLLHALSSADEDICRLPRLSRRCERVPTSPGSSSPTSGRRRPATSERLDQGRSALLASSSLPLARVAIHCGFGSQRFVPDDDPQPGDLLVPRAEVELAQRGK